MIEKLNVYFADILLKNAKLMLVGLSLPLRRPQERS